MCVLELCDTTSSLRIMILQSGCTLGIDTFNVHMINDLHKTVRTPFYVEMQF